MEKIALKNRLKRLSGQLQKLEQDIDNDKDCSEVVPQFLAVKGAVSAAYEEYIRLALDECSKTDQKKMQQLIKMLVKI